MEPKQFAEMVFPALKEHSIMESFVQSKCRAALRVGLDIAVDFAEWYVHEKTRLTPKEALPIYLKTQGKR